MRIVSLALGTIFFVIIFPGILISLGMTIKNVIVFTLPRYFEWIILVPCLGIGLIFLVWATVLQWTIGEGTPAPNAPTRRLITSGLYGLCRNPIELGAIFYYMGIGTLYDGIETGIICFIFGFFIGSIYNKFVEEKELEFRFGNEYKEYKQRVPFIIPKLRFFR
jgi:protein-S-isoprenylcysteine O-methyltransferase Ste14